jgi:hypothetical protein
MKQMLRRFDEILSEKVSKSALAEYKEIADQTYLLKKESKLISEGIDSKFEKCKESF